MFWQEIKGSTVQLPLTVSYKGTGLRRFRFWVHLHDVVFSLRQFGGHLKVVHDWQNKKDVSPVMLIQCSTWCPGFTEEFIDEMKETLAGSNLHLLLLTALVTAVQVSHTFIAHSWSCRCSVSNLPEALDFFLVKDELTDHQYTYSSIKVMWFSFTLNASSMYIKISINKSLAPS